MRVSTQIYLIRDGQWLMLLRNKKKKDINHGKWIAVGGKQEASETVEECAIRETEEETGFTLDSLDLKGIVWFEYDDEESELIYVYTSDSFHGELKECSEGTLAWINESELMNLQLWEGDRLFMQKLIERCAEQFEYVLHYDSSGNLTNVIERKRES